mgnify:CR=1 FL=1
MAKTKSDVAFGSTYNPMNQIRAALLVREMSCTLGSGLIDARHRI